MSDTTERPSDDAPPPYPRRGDSDERGERPPGAWRMALVVAAIVALGALTRVSILVVVLAIVVMIFFHELGHYLAAKWSGMKVTEFFIGFGPKIWSFRKGETEYGLKAIPAGAYVRIIGMSNLEEVPEREEHRTYRQQSYPRRMAVALAGSAMHFVMAFACILFLLAGTGIRGGTVMDIDRLEAAWERQAEGPWIVGAVTPNSAADRAGLEPGDEIVTIAGDRVERWEDVRAAVLHRGGENIAIVFMRDGERRTASTTLGVQQGHGFLGIGPEFTTSIDERVAPHRAVVQSVEELGIGMRLAMGALGQFFTGGIADFAGQVVTGGERAGDPTVGGGGAPSGEGDGPAADGENRLISILGATRLGADLTDEGLAGLLVFLVNINIFIGIFNLIPLLPLDGGHVAIATYERIRSRRGQRYMADISRLMPLTYAVVMVLIVLGLSSLYLDIVNPINLR